MITLTDMFCGCGGSSQGAHAAGVEIKLAANHWPLAIETHNTNFPNVAHDCADINQVDPRRWPRTTMLWASPECTNHSLAKGIKRDTGQLDMFDPAVPDPSAERSRATMWDVPRFAEYHDYQMIVVENVVDARKWRLWPAWIHAMECLGYEGQVCYFNSMFFGVPQSRDRMYVVFWKKGQQKPALDYRPPAWCPTCERYVNVIQSFKTSFHWGCYGERRQYVYCCPVCATKAVPFHVPAATVIDWSNIGQRIGDRAKPLKVKTIERIRRGIEKYAQMPIVVETAYGGDHQIAGDVFSVLPTQTTRQTFALSIPPSMIMVMRNGADAQSPDQPLTTICASAIHHGLLLLNYSPGYAKPVTDPLSTLTATDHHAFVMSYYTRDSAHSDVAAPLNTLTGEPRHALINMPFVLDYYGTGGDHGVDDPVGTITTRDRHALVQSQSPGIPNIDDCHFRMLTPHEVQLGMAFSTEYTVLGTNKDRVRQCGNAVTPPVAQWLVERCVAVL